MANETVLNETNFSPIPAGWEWASSPHDGEYCASPRGVLITGTGEDGFSIDGFGEHTRNGDSIELAFSVEESASGCLTFGFAGGFEFVSVELDFMKERLSLFTSDWACAQPVNSVSVTLRNAQRHVLLIEKARGAGKLVENADIKVWLNGEPILGQRNVNVLPEMGVRINVKRARVMVERFVHKGFPSGIPEYLRVGGWQMPNQQSITENLDSLFRGLRESADRGVQLLVTPETSLTGLFPLSHVGRDARYQAKLNEAESQLSSFLRSLANAPYLVAGLPVWEEGSGRGGKQTRFNVSRVYDPDGNIASSHPKIHSCEYEFGHGYRLQEFDVNGVPICMHICHDSRYPEVWTLPVMFGARIVLIPASGTAPPGSPKERVESFEARAKMSTATSHAFCVYANAGGGSFIAGPKNFGAPGTFDNLLAVSSECMRSAPSFPLVGDVGECLVWADVRVHDAFGYWPVRSFRASEATAAAYAALYRSMGGSRSVAADVPDAAEIVVDSPSEPGSWREADVASEC